MLADDLLVPSSCYRQYEKRSSILVPEKKKIPMKLTSPCRRPGESQGDSALILAQKATEVVTGS